MVTVEDQSAQVKRLKLKCGQFQQQCAGFDESYSYGDVLKWLSDHTGDNSAFTRKGADSVKSAANMLVISVNTSLPAEEALLGDVRKLGDYINDLATRVMRGKRIKKKTVQSYVTKTELLLNEFLTYQRNPLEYTPRSLRSKSGDGSGNCLVNGNSGRRKKMDMGQSARTQSSQAVPPPQEPSPSTPQNANSSNGFGDHQIVFLESGEKFVYHAPVGFKMSDAQKVFAKVLVDATDFDPSVYRQILEVLHSPQPNPSGRQRQFPG